MSRGVKKIGLRCLYVVTLGLLIGLPTELAHPPAAPITAPQAPAPTPPAATNSAGNTVKRTARLPVPPVWFNNNTSTHQPAAVSKPAYTTQLAASTKKTIRKDTANKMLTIDDAQYPLRTYTPLAAPNDPSANQWWVSNASLAQAWDTPAGSHETILAVIDTGFALRHEEFADRWYVNPGESGPVAAENPSSLNCANRGLALDANCNLIDDDSNGVIDDETGAAQYQNPSRLNCTDQLKSLAKDCNRIDDDGNDLVDDTTGWDFANGDNSSQAGELNPNGSGTVHGTETAGVAAATGDNAKGIAGVDWHTKILPIQALSDDSYGDTLGVGQSILYAISQHANVISLSLGSVYPDDYVRYAVAKATAAGIVVVAAAGNSGCNCITYPANYPEVVAVGALATNNVPASFSSYGTNLDIVAPGTQITSPAWSAGNPTTAYASNLAGTSFATPLVSGMMTRLLSIRPDMTPLQLIAAVTENTNRLALASTVSRSPQLGYGSLNGQAATGRVSSARSTSYSYVFSPVSRGAYLMPTTPTEPTSSYSVQRCESGRPGSTPVYELTKGTASFWTISQTEVWQAQNNGYAATLLTEACLQQPQDSPGTFRLLTLFKDARITDLPS